MDGSSQVLASSANFKAGMQDKNLGQGGQTTPN